MQIACSIAEFKLSFIQTNWSLGEVCLVFVRADSTKGADIQVLYCKDNNPL